MLKLKNLKFVGSVFLLVVGLSATTASSQPAAKFSSVYTDTTRQCKGAEPVFNCTGYGGYRLVMDVGGVFQSARVESSRPEFSLAIAERQSVGWNPTVEWRMADGKPFAVIVRVDVNDENAEVPQKIGEKLIVKGLRGHESINETVDAKTSQANEKAREMADKGFVKESGAAAQSDTASTNENSAEEPDIHGFFFIKGKVPPGFADIDHLNLGGKGEYGAKATPPYYGLIRLKSKTAKDYRLLKPTMSGKNFSFKTEAAAGVSYEFEGAFTRLDFTEEGKQPTEVGDSAETVLSGTLKKMKAGKMIAEGKVAYSWYLGD